MWLSLILACGDPEPAAPAEADPPEVPYAPVGDEFLVVVLPDTQIYAMSYPATFDAQLRWVAERADDYRVAFVTHVGDIVQTADADAEWAVAEAAYGWLEDLDIPHGFSVGGHDFSVGGVAADSSCANFADVDCTFSDYLQRFGPSRYEGRPWFAGASPSGWSSAQRVSAGGLDLLFLHLPQDPPRAEVDWAHQVLDANPGTLAHVTTHRHLFDYRLTEWLPPPLNLLPAGRFNALTYLLGGQTLKFTSSLDAETLFQELIAAHPNIWAVHCGHVDAEFHQQATNAAGLPVYEILVDFQDMADGGGGFLRVLKFKPSAGQVEVFTVSALTGEIRQNGDGFAHSLDILEAYEEAAAAELASFGVDLEALAELLSVVREEGSADQEAYRDSLYAGGQRDSRFTLDVDFKKYVQASR
jgi:hypothetical protein